MNYNCSLVFLILISIGKAPAVIKEADARNKIEVFDENDAGLADELADKSLLLLDKLTIPATLALSCLKSG